MFPSPLMQNFISQTALYGNKVIRSKHEHHFDEDWAPLSLFELNDVNSVVFRFALANYVCLNSLDDVIARIENEWPPIVNYRSVNAFSITEIREAYDRGDIDSLYHIRDYLHLIIEIGEELGFSYQDQFTVAENNPCQQISDFFFERDENIIPFFEELGYDEQD